MLQGAVVMNNERERREATGHLRVATERATTTAEAAGVPAWHLQAGAKVVRLADVGDRREVERHSTPRGHVQAAWVRPPLRRPI